MARKLARQGVPFTKEDLEDCEMEGLLKAMELDGHEEAYIATAVGNKVRDMAKRLVTRHKKTIRLEDFTE